jgi:rubrerythrin
MITGFIILGILVLLFQGRNNISNETKDDLEEWDCPLCGFHIQMGEICTYCYTKKSK